MPFYFPIFIISAIVVSQLPSLIGIELVSLCAVFAAAIICIQFFLSAKNTKFLAVLVTRGLCSFVIFFAINTVHGHYLLSKQFDDQLLARKCQVLGVVTGIVSIDASRAKFNLAVSDAQCNNTRVGLANIALSIYYPKIKVVAGDRLTLDVKLKTPRSLYSVGAFDTGLWALNNNISGVGYVRKVVKVEPRFSYLYGVRGRISEWLNQLPISEQSKATLQALVLGNKSQFNDQQWQQMRHSGTVHLFVVSGLHIGLMVVIGWWLFFVIRILFTKLHYPYSLLYLPDIGALILSFNYMLLAGAGLSTQRAWLMAFVLIFGRFLSSSVSVWQRWWFALTAVVLLQPLSVVEPGLWLSFSAVASLILLQHYRAKNYKWRVIIKSQLWVWLALLPVLLLFFQQMSFISPLVNLFAISLMSMILMVLPVALVFSYLDWHFLLSGLAFVIDWFWRVLNQIDGFASNFVVAVDNVSTFVIVVVALACLSLMLPSRRRIKVISLCVWSLVFYPANLNVLNAPHFQLTVFNVGQGLAVYASTAKHRLLFDTGAGFGGFNYFDAVVKPYLAKHSVKNIDLLTISHVDNDHSGGLKAAQSLLQIDRLDSDIGEQVKIGPNKCISGRVWQWDGVSFKYRQRVTLDNTNTNNTSCVLELTNQFCKILIMADAEKEIELTLLPTQQPALSTVLIVGHHGSNTSTSHAFLQSQPFDYAVISNGYQNRYGHPHHAVLARLEKQNIAVYRTDLQGSINITSTHQGCDISSYRDTAKRYWW
ncbi:DNA internalization-related competence protein ComEC/Rec2 [Gammaproteobacteria bacterium AS21]